MSKKHNPDAPLTDEEWEKLGKPMKGIDALPKEAREAVERAKRGRPSVDNPKEKVTIRLDKDLLEELRASGSGWQTRLNSAIREWLHK